MAWIVNTNPGITLGDTDYDAYPDAVRLTSGRLVAGWETMLDHETGSPDDIGNLRISDDNGATWWNPGPPPAPPMALASLGNRIAMAELTREATRKSYVYVSNDGGETWGTRHPTSGWNNVAGWVFLSDLCWIDDTTPDGLLLATSYGPDGITIVASTDAGSTWNFHARAHEAAGPWQDATEACITHLPDGDLLMCLRSDTHATMSTLRSSDMGLTWTAPVVALTGVEGLPRPTVMPDGTILVTLRDMPASPPHPRLGVWVLGVSINNGHTWTKSTVINEWMMYGRVLPLIDGTAILVGSSEAGYPAAHPYPGDRARCWVRAVSSTQMVVVAHVHSTPLHVVLDVTAIPTGVDTITAFDGRTQQRVASRAVSGSAGVFFDHTAPAGEAVYLIRAYTNGVQVAEQSIIVETPEPPQSHVWISDPLDETSTLLVPLLIEGDRERPRHANVSVARTVGGRTIASIGPRHLGEWVIVIKAEDPEMIRRLQDFFDNASSLLVRAGSEMFLPGRLYAALPDVSESLRLYRPVPDGAWALSCLPADAPGIDPVISTWTYDALELFCEAHGITYDNLGDAFPTYLELERGPVGGV